MKTRLGIHVARALVAGDASLARALACGCWHWSVAEARAIAGAVRFANERYDARINVMDFFGGAR